MTHIRHKAAQVENDLLFMSHLSQKIGPLADPDQITRVVTRAVGEYLDGHRCFFFELDETDNMVVVGQDWSRGETPSLTVTSCPQNFGTPELLRAVAAGRTVMEDVTKHPLTRDSANGYEQLCIRSLVMAPFIRDERWVVSLALADERSRDWSNNELALLEAVIANTWPLVERARIEQKLRKSEMRLRFLSNITKILVSSLDPSMMLKEIAENSLSTLGNFCFFDVRTENNQIDRVAWAHEYPERREQFRDMMGIKPLARYAQPAVLRVILSGEPVFEPNVTDEWKQQIASSPESLEIMRRMDFHSLICVPVVVAGETLGAMTFCFIPPNRRHTKEDLGLAEEVGRRAAFALSHARLYQQSLDRAEQLRRSEQALKEAIRLKDDFLATVSHELRSPLNSILGYVRLLRSIRPDEQTLARNLDIIERNARMQAQLIEDLLDTSRIVGDQLRLEQHSLDLAEVIEKALDVVRPSAEAKGVALHATLNRQIGQITGDPNRLQQVVWNLLSNAIKFTPEGGRVNVELWVENAYACVAVCDTGEGIDAEFLPYVFDRFRQADASSSRRHGGLGLGLALVRHIVELHGGKVEVLSDGPGQGATFIIRLPVPALQSEKSPDHFLAEEAWAKDTLISPDAPSLTGVRVLVVDDEEEVCELLAIVLAKYGAEIITASSGEEALRLLFENSTERPPDLLVCDIGMPDEDGYMILRRLREREDERGVPPAKRIPAIALTAYVQASDRVRALAAGYRMHVSKPVDYDELATVIASLTGRLQNGLDQTTLV